MNMRRLMRSRQGLAASRATGLPGVPVKLYRLAYFRGYTTSKLRYAGMQVCRLCYMYFRSLAPQDKKSKESRCSRQPALTKILSFNYYFFFFPPI